jgi:hypothetical protein
MAMAETVPNPMPAAHRGRRDALLRKSRRVCWFIVLISAVKADFSKRKDVIFQKWLHFLKCRDIDDNFPGKSVSVFTG